MAVADEAGYVPCCLAASCVPLTVAYVYMDLAPHYGITENMGWCKCCLPLLSYYQILDTVLVKEGLHMTMAGVAKDVKDDVDRLRAVLAMVQPEARTEMLRLNVEALARQPGRVDVFRATAENVCANLLSGEAAPPADLAEALAQLQRDLAVLCPPEPGQYLVDDARALAGGDGA